MSNRSRAKIMELIKAETPLVSITSTNASKNKMAKTQRIRLPIPYPSLPHPFRWRAVYHLPASLLSQLSDETLVVVV
jgi:hypothetical protein